MCLFLAPQEQTRVRLSEMFDCVTRLPFLLVPPALITSVFQVFLIWGLSYYYYRYLRRGLCSRSPSPTIGILTLS